MVNEGFTQKEMLIRIMDKMEIIEIKMDRKLGELHEKVNSTHDLASQTNGKVKIHTKLIFGLAGVLFTIVGWLIVILIK